MSAELPLYRPEPSLTEIVVGAPVRGRLARELAHLLHWCNAHGMQVIPAHCPLVAFNGTTTLRYRMAPQGRAITRVWVVLLSQPEAFSGGTTPARVEMQAPDSVVHTITPDTVTSVTLAHTMVREDLTAKSEAEQVLTLTFSYKAGTALATIESVACWELPRAILTQDTYDRGVDLETCQAGQPIYDSIGKSLGAITRNLAYSWPRRSLIQYSGYWMLFSAGTFTDFTPLAEPCLPHKTLRADTTLTCKWAIYVKTAAATTGEVRVTTGIDGTTATETIATDTSGGWITGTIALRCDDPTTSDGLPAGGWETIMFAVRVTAGTNISVGSYCVWEPVTVESFLLLEDGSYLLQEDGNRVKLEG